MYQPHIGKYECDQCGKLVPKSQPILIVEEHGEVLYFCSQHCKDEHGLEQMVAFVEGE